MVPTGAKVSKFTGLLDVALHPDFAKQPFIYFSYNKILPGNKEAIAVARKEPEDSLPKPPQAREGGKPSPALVSLLKVLLAASCEKHHVAPRLVVCDAPTESEIEWNEQATCDLAELMQERRDPTDSLSLALPVVLL